MAVMYIRGSGMSSEDRAREEGTVSSLKEVTEVAFPDGETVSGVPAQMTDDERQALAVRVGQWEKDGLIKRKQSGNLGGQSLKDTRARYGAPREWDHLQLSFDRAESDSLTSDQLEQARRAIIDVAGRDIGGVHRKMTISRIHTDTGNTHVDVFVHRHAYNAAENAALPADELTAPSRLASVIEQINKRLRGLDLPPMSDVKKQDGRSLYEESATSDKAKSALNEMVQEAGGLPTQRTGAPAMGETPTPIPRITDPDASALERLVRDAERDAKSAAQRLVDAQNALEAQRQRLELRERVEHLEADVVARDASIATREATIADRDRLIESERLASAEAIAASQAQRAELQQHLEQTQGQLEVMGGKFTQAAQERDDARERITGLEADYATAQEEIGQQQGVITTLQTDLAGVITERDSERAARVAAEAQRDQAQQLAADQAARADQAEAARNALQQQLDAERAARAAAEVARDQAQQTVLQAQQAQQATVELLKMEKMARTEERSLFEQVKTGLQDMVASLKEQLQSVKDTLSGVTGERDDLRAKRQAEAERLRELSAAIERDKAQAAQRNAAKDTEIAALKQRVADFEGGSDNDGGGQAAPKTHKPPGKR